MVSQDKGAGEAHPIICLILKGDSAFKDMAGKEEAIIHLTGPFTVAALERGMRSGNPSLSIRIDLPDGRVVVQETSMRMWLTVARALEAKFGRLT